MRTQTLPIQTSIEVPNATVPDPDLIEAARENEGLASWAAALTSQGRATMDEAAEERLYSRAALELEMEGVAPSQDAIGAWVAARMSLG